ncbi:hypothetical protein MKEN_00068700 [Mycena kentingensis (nom. inval.)]|nr:hypothetical protein MKEN_00068700 [Mycena kentingensis (nom. inval.)]
MASVPRLARRVYSSLNASNQPSWSVHQLLASYPRPSLPPPALKRLHDLSALVPPEQDTPEYLKLKTELEELIRLVEAVKLVDTSGVPPYQAPISDAPADAQPTMALPLLGHAARTKNGFYIVDADMPQ